MSLPTQSIGGLISGFDTNSIIEQLMAIERRPVTNLENKITELQAQQEAYSTLSSMVLSFKNTINVIGKSTTYNSKMATSSNDSILSATAYEGAAVGTYTFKTARLAQTNQFTSTGLSDKNNVSLGAGTISIDSGKASFKNSTKLAELNGNMGVSRGSIRIKDRSGTSEIIDLSDAETIQDVLNTINNASVDVQASISSDGRGLTITDLSGSTINDLVIENAGSGSMADDLGIATDGTAGDVVGSDIFYLSETNSLSLLNDGIGIEKGIIHIKDNVSGETYDIDLSDTNTMRDVLKEINSVKDSSDNTVFNATISGRGIEITNVLGNDFTVTDDVNSEMATQLGIIGNSTGDTITGGNLIGEMDTTMLSNITAGGIPYTAGIVEITDRSGNTVQVDLTGAETLRDVIDGINNSGAGVKAQINKIGNGIVIKDTTGSTTSNLTITDNTGELAAAFGILVDDAVNEIDGGDLDRQYIGRATLLNSLNGGEGIYGGSIRLTDANGDSATGNLSGLKTVGDVITAINSAGLAIEARINGTGDGILLVNTEGSGEIRVEEADSGSTAKDLGIVGSASDGKSINGSYEVNIDVSESDTLSNLAYKIAFSGANIQTSIIDDGSGVNQYHLSIQSGIAGKAGELMIDSSVLGLDFSESTKAQDALLLYGGGDGSSSPMLISSSSNRFQSAVPGMTLVASKVSLGESVTINVEQDIDSIVSGFEEMVTAYNDYAEIHDVLTRWDTDNEVGGLLFGDSQANGIMNEIKSMILSTVEGVEGGLSQWYDLGIKFNYDEETQKTRLKLDSTTLMEALSTNFDGVKQLMTMSADVANSGYDATISATNPAANGTSIRNLINGNVSTGDFPDNNGYEATNAVDNDEIIINFDKAREVNQLIINHIDTPDMPAAEYSISDYIVEYWDTKTNNWTVAREYVNNKSSLNYVSLPDGTTTDKIRLTVSDTNAPDKKVRLVEIQAMENQGSGSRLLSRLNNITDNIDGVFTTQNDTIESKISDIETTIERMEKRMEMKEVSLINQWSAMESTLAQLQQQGDFFTQQMNALNGSD